MAIYKLENQIQKYAWGSADAMGDLLGYPNPNNEPMAELWMGAHPKSPSIAIDANPQSGNANGLPLNEMIEESPEALLGPETSLKYGGRLPFLFKVLAAASPLSIQAHPSLDEAGRGFARENAAGIALDAFNRNYKDDNHKPEIICALTEYHAMRGFRPAAEITVNFRKIMIPELEDAVNALEMASTSPSGNQSTVDSAVSIALKNFFIELMGLKDEPLTNLINRALAAGSAGNVSPTDARWIKRFAELYPGDIGIVSPLYLNIVTLHPGEAMFLPAGVLHAYLEGLGMELMANSDNVLRCGLTPKHIDLPELLSTLSFEPGKPEILSPVSVSENEKAYITGAPEFYLSKIELKGGSYDIPSEKYGPKMPSIFICLEGSVEIIDAAEVGVNRLTIGRGDTAFASFGSRLTLNGTGILYRASVPEQAQ